LGTIDYLAPFERNAVFHLKLVLLDWFSNDIVDVLLFGNRVKDKNANEKEMDVLIVAKDLDKAKLDRINMIVI